jgi:hypothetical protein
MRKLAVVLLLALLAVGAWWTAYPRTAPQAVGWCVEQRGQEVRLKDCGVRPSPGFLRRGKVVGHIQHVYADLMGEPPFTRGVSTRDGRRGARPPAAETTSGALPRHQARREQRPVSWTDVVPS